MLNDFYIMLFIPNLNKHKGLICKLRNKKENVKAGLYIEV